MTTEAGQAYLNLRELLGYTQNGTQRTVRLCQDDATGLFAVNVDDRTYCDGFLTEAIKKAHTGEVN